MLLNELGRRSYNNGSLLLIAFVHLFFIQVLRFINTVQNEDKIDAAIKERREAAGKKATFLTKIIRKVPEEEVIGEFVKERVYINYELKMKLLKIGTIVLGAIVLILFISVINKPFFIVKLDRFLYRARYLGYLADKITNSMVYAIPLLGIYYLHSKKKLVWIVIGLFSLYLFWIGHKFAYFVDIGHLLLLTFVYYANPKLINKIFKLSCIGLIVLFIVVSIQSFVVYNRNFAQNIIYFNARFAQQGQMWWSIYDNKFTRQNNIKEFNDELQTFFNVNVTQKQLYNAGTYKMMRKVTPSKIFISKVYEKRSRYAYTTQASMLYYFKDFGLICFTVISAVLYYFVINNLIKSTVSMNLIPTVIYSRILFIIQRVLIQADYHRLFSLEMLLWVLILTIYKFIEKSKYRHYLV
jgi:hypothetical protein